MCWVRVSYGHPSIDISMSLFSSFRLRECDVHECDQLESKSSFFFLVVVVFSFSFVASAEAAAAALLVADLSRDGKGCLVVLSFCMYRL